MTGQFGKNHLGDKDEFLPTNHGFDEFFGNLYHLNAEEEPENADYPKNPEFKKKFGPRGVIKATAGGPDRGHRSAHEEADGDDRRGGAGRSHRFPWPREEGGQAVLLLVQHDADAQLYAREGRRISGKTGHLDSTPTAWSNTTPSSARCSTQSTNSG